MVRVCKFIPFTMSINIYSALALITFTFDSVKHLNRNVFALALHFPTIFTLIAIGTDGGLCVLFLASLLHVAH